MQRNVFNLAQDQYTRTSGPVTSLACSDVTSTSTSTSNFEGKGQQIWVGLATGYVEEYRMEDSTSTSYSSGSSRSRFDDENTLGVVPQLRLFRSEKVSKKPIDQLCVVSSGESKVLFALSGQHLWMIKDQDQNQHDQGPNQRGFVTQVKESALKGVFFIAQDLCNVGCRNVLALCRTSLAPGLPKKLKLVFLEVSAQTSDSERSVFVLHEQVFDAAKEVVSSSTQVKEAVWYGDSVLLRTDKNYVHLSLSSQSAKEIFAHNNHRTSSHALGGSNSFFSKQDPSSQEQSEVCSHQYMIPIVEKKLTLLLAEDIGTIVNMMGEPTGSMVQFPTEPMAIHAMCYPYLLAVFAKSVYVYDIRKDLRDAHVQTIPFSNYFLSPAKVDRVPVTSWTSVSAEKGENQIFVMVGHNDMLLFLSQTPLEEQCREMLRAHKFKECLQVAYTSQAPNYRDYLIENSCAEAFFHLMERLDVEEALAFLVTCKEFQPSQLFPLFPEYTSVWKTQVVRKRYWSMHPPLASLEDLIKQNANANANASDNNNTGVDKKIKEALVHYLLQIRQNQNQKEKEKGKEKEVFGKEILLVDGVDTLLVQLLLDIGDIEVLEKLATDPNHVVIQQVEARLCSLGRIHALALLNESHKQYRVAAELWVSLCEKKRIELPSPGSFLTRQLSLKPNESLMTVVPLELARVLRKAGTESSATREFLPWLMEHSVDISLTLLSDLSLSVEGIMNMLQATKGTKGSRWKYLDYVVNVKMSTNPMHHSEFAIAMIDLWKSHNNDEDADADGNRPGKELDRKDICSRLEAFLEGSDYYNTQAVILALKGTKLWAEQVIVNKKIGNHKEALHLLAFTMDDRERAVSYCEELGTQEGYLTLLDMFLNPPGEDSLPLYGDAVRLLGSKGASLNPLRVLEALSDNMPMPLAYETLTRMLRERQHRKRSGQIMKGLARAHELSVAQDRVLSLSEHIEMTAERACRVCNLRIGTKVFGLYPNGVLVCYRCMMRNGNKDVQHVCPVTGRNFKKELL